MTDLRQRVDRLEERVEELEMCLDDSATPSSPATDHRDDAVLSVLEQSGGEPEPWQLANLYQRHTDITNDATAKQRAKNLRQTPAYTKAVEK